MKLLRFLGALRFVHVESERTSGTSSTLGDGLLEAGVQTAVRLIKQWARTLALNRQLVGEGGGQRDVQLGDDLVNTRQQIVTRSNYLFLVYLRAFLREGNFSGAFPYGHLSRGGGCRI